MRYLKHLALILFVAGCAVALQTCCACGSSYIQCRDGSSDPGPPPDQCTFDPGVIPAGAGSCSCPSIQRCYGRARCVTGSLGTSTTPCCSSECDGCDNCGKTTYNPVGESKCAEKVTEYNCLHDETCSYTA